MESVNLVFNFNGKWMCSNGLKYSGGESKVENLDIDFLSFTHMVKKYKNEFGMPAVHKLLYEKHGEMNLLENDAGICGMTEYIKEIKGDDFLNIYPIENIDMDTQFSTYTGGQKVVQKVSESFTINKSNLDMNDLIEDLIDEGVSEREHGYSQTNQVGVNGIHVDEVQGILGGNPQVDEVQGDNVSGSECDGVNLSDIETNFESEDDIYFEMPDSDAMESESESDAIDGESEIIGKKLIAQSMRIVKYDVDDHNPHFMIGMTFLDAVQARLAITRYSIAKSTPLKFIKNERHRIRVKCQADECPFLLFISKDGITNALMIKTLIPEHNCLRDVNNNLATAKFLASELKSTIQVKPKTRIKELIVDAENKLKVIVSKEKVKRARRLAIHELDGSFKAEYGYLAAYVDAMKKNDPDTTAHLERCEEALTHGRFVFKRLYICFDALKKGWKAGCRPIIGLDGCHLKGVVKGVVLVAVGKDGNDQIFPIAWAVIGAENKNNWTWFLELLVKDLEIHENGKHVTIMSDMQKGLVVAVKDLLPAAEHRYCARHVYANWSKKRTDEELRKRFWVCSWSTYKEEFDDNLKILGNLNKRAAEDFVAYNPGAFCRAFFSDRCKSSMVDNNICESFNASILEARHKPIISMLDDMRHYVMRRFATNKAAGEKWTSKWTPACIEMYQHRLNAAFGNTVVFNGSTGYEVCDRNDRHTVCLDKMVCSCREWDLTGIPCSHAICAIKSAKKDPKTFISDWFHKSKYLASYEHAIQPLGGKQFYNCGGYESLEPPRIKKMVGRPKVVRIRGTHESTKGKTSGKLPRKPHNRSGVKLHCTICRSEKHNRTKCPKKSESQTQDSNTQDETAVQSTVSRSRRTCGLGILINQKTGSMTLNPGCSSETLIRQGDPITSQPLRENSNHTVKFPIPNEREIRQEKQSAPFGGSRKISFADGAPGETINPTHLPFKPSGLKWKGKSSMSTRQLEAERDKKRAKKRDNNA